jgi:hypothetical protein
MDIRVEIYYEDCDQCKLHYLRNCLSNGGPLAVSFAHLDHLAKDHNVRCLVITVEENEDTKADGPVAQG